MKIHILLISLFLTVAFNSLKAQMFPYLNASTGNVGQYIVDSDTNIIMFHDNQIEKLDKNFNPIWVKNYNGLNFYSLLLSKSGSIYFIASDTINYFFSVNTPNIGKLDKNGNLIWCNSASNDTITFYKLLLDRNNNIIASCNKGLIKFDTTGNMLSYKKIRPNNGYISDISKLTVLEDSSGYYSAAFAYTAFEASGMGFFKYSEPLDSFIIQKYYEGFYQHWQTENVNFYTSSREPSTYYSISTHYNGSIVYSVRKNNKENSIWENRFAYNSTYPYDITSFDEDPNKNILFNISPWRDGIHVSYNSSNIKFDSTGYNNGMKKDLLNYSWWPPQPVYETSKLHYLFGGNYFYTFIGKNFPANPLSITVLDSSVNSYCSGNSNLFLISNFSTTSSSGHFLTKQTITPYALSNKPVTTTNILNFSTANNYCSTLGHDVLINNKEKVTIYPSPVSNVLNLSSSHNIENVSIYNITGKIVLFDSNQTSIDVSKLNSGIYFIKVVTSKSEFKQKFIKE